MCVCRKREEEKLRKKERKKKKLSKKRKREEKKKQKQKSQCVALIFTISNFFLNFSFVGQFQTAKHPALKKRVRIMKRKSP